MFCPRLTTWPFKMCTVVSPFAITSIVFHPSTSNSPGSRFWYPIPFPPRTRCLAPFLGFLERGLFVAASLGIDPGVERESIKRQQVADIRLLDLELKASRPHRVRPVEMIIKARVTLQRVPRLELLGSPPILKTKVVIAILLLSADVPHHHLAALGRILVKVDRVLFDRDDMIGVAVLPVLLQERVPAGQVPSVE